MPFLEEMASLAPWRWRGAPSEALKIRLANFYASNPRRFVV
jgi:hypothetical protein